jgi:hypothetical protein
MVLAKPSLVRTLPIPCLADRAEYTKFYANIPQCQMVILGAGWVSCRDRKELMIEQAIQELDGDQESTIRRQVLRLAIDYFCIKRPLRGFG